MRSFSLAILACGLCFIVPAAAVASDVNGQPGATTPATVAKLVRAEGPYGATPAAGSLPKLVPAKGSNGVTPAPGSLPKLLKAKGPYGMTPAPGSLPELVAAKGPYGMTLAGGSQVVAASAHHPVATEAGGMNGWRVAAISEAALFALLALGAARLMTGRRRAMHLGV
jgi:hypothetical protein